MGSDYYVSGRHTNTRKINKGETELYEYIDPLVTGFGLYNKSRKINDDSHSNDRVLGYGKNSKTMANSLPQSKVQMIKLKH